MSAQDHQNDGHSNFGLVTGIDSIGLNTGDLLFFQNRVLEGVLIYIGTLSPMTHVAMVVRDMDGQLWLTHSTDNEYNGHSIPVKNELHPRGGIILTKLENAFLSTDNGQSGFYKKIWVYKLNDRLIKRPEPEQVLALYEKNKFLAFESSPLRFLFSAYDLILGGKDLISFPENDSKICSDYVYCLLRDLNFPVEQNQKPNEYSPGDICYLITPLYHSPKLFMFRDGKYRLTKNK